MQSANNSFLFIESILLGDKYVEKKYACGPMDQTVLNSPTKHPCANADVKANDMYNIYQYIINK